MKIKKKKKKRALKIKNRFWRMRTKCNEKRMVAIEMGTHTTHLSNGNVDQMAFEHIVFLILILLLFIVHQARRSNFLLSLDDKMFLLFYFIFFFFCFHLFYCFWSRSSSSWMFNVRCEKYVSTSSRGLRIWELFVSIAKWRWNDTTETDHEDDNSNDDGDDDVDAFEILTI